MRNPTKGGSFWGKQMQSAENLNCPFAAASALSIRLNSDRVGIL
jgi:hypothetical protein